MEKKYVVIKIPDTNKFGIISADGIKKMPYCETFNKYGQQIGCYDAGCYSLDNSSSGVHKNLQIAIKEEFGIAIQIDLRFQIDGSLSSEENEEIKAFISSWIEENTSHVECESFNFWDGRNWQSFVIDIDLGEPPVLRLEEDDPVSISILSEMPETPYINGISETIETESWIYTASRMQDDPFIFTVAEII